MEALRALGGFEGDIAELELGKRGAQPRTRRKLAAALGVEPWELVEDLPGR